MSSIFVNNIDIFNTEFINNNEALHSHAPAGSPLHSDKLMGINSFPHLVD